MGSLSCGAIFVKYLLCLFNFAFFVVGGLVLALSIWLAVDNTSFLLITRLTNNPSLEVYNTPSVLEHGAYVLIAAGALIFILGFLGCCGAAMESRSLLTTYGLLVIVLFALQVTGGVMAAVYKTQAEEELEDLLKLSLHKYYSTPQRANAITLAWDHVMEKLDCCGVNNYTDFEKAALWQTNKTSEQVIPIACCRIERDKLHADDPFVLTPIGSNSDPEFENLLLDLALGDDPQSANQRQRQRQRNRQGQKNRLQMPVCATNPSAENSNYLTGCRHKLYSVIINHLPVVFSALIFIGCLEMLAVVLACYVCRAISRAKRYQDVLED